MTGANSQYRPEHGNKVISDLAAPEPVFNHFNRHCIGFGDVVLLALWHNRFWCWNRIMPGLFLFHYFI
jgi:hypothetical protein